MIIENIKPMLHQQDSDLEVIVTLLPYLKDKTFIDIGAEKGTFTTFLHSQGLHGFFFEPLPIFSPILSDIAAQTNCVFLPFAIDSTDRTANFYIASDLQNNPVEHFSSLHPLHNDKRIQHAASIPVICRSLNSLQEEGVLNEKFGIIKIDTEGNDLQVLMGMTKIDCDILMCEFCMPGIYAGWDQAHPLKLIEQVRQLGFTHCITLKRAHVYELISLDNFLFTDLQWGNLIFINDEIFNASFADLKKITEASEQKFYQSVVTETNLLQNEINMLRKTCQERLDVITTNSVTAQPPYAMSERAEVLNPEK